MRVRRGAASAQSHDHGAVAVEAAFGIGAIASFLLIAAWCLSVVLGQLSLGEAARAGARVAARGEPDTAVAEEAHRLDRGIAVRVSREGDHVVVDVARDMRAPGLLARLGPLHLTATAVALVEAAS